MGLKQEDVSNTLTFLKEVKCMLSPKRKTTFGTHTILRILKEFLLALVLTLFACNAVDNLAKKRQRDRLTILPKLRNESEEFQQGV